MLAGLYLATFLITTGCEDPGNWGNATRSPDIGYKFGLGDIVTYVSPWSGLFMTSRKCPDGMRRVPGATRECLRNNRWSSMNPNCEPGKDQTSEEFDLPANSLSVHIETHGKLILRTFS